MTHQIRLYYFPKGLRWTSPAIAIFVWLMFPGYWIVGVIATAISLFIFTAQYVTIIDVDRKEFRDGFSFYWMNLITERKKYYQLDRIILTKGRYQQQLNSRAHSTTMKWIEYAAILVYNGDEKLELVRREEKEDVVEFAKLYSHSLNIPIEDHSSVHAST